MIERHYTYYMIADDPFYALLLERELPVLYAGVRTCRCKPEDDPYMGSSEYVKLAMAMGITFTKVVLNTYKTRKMAAMEEADLLKQLNVDQKVWSIFFNRNVPGQFAPGSRIFKILQSVGKKGGWKVNGPQKGKGIGGGPAKGYRQSSQHVANVKSSLTSYWQDMAAYCEAHGIESPGKGGCNINREDFNQWRQRYSQAT